MASWVFKQSANGIANASSTTVSASLTNSTAGSLVFAWVAWFNGDATVTVSDGTNSYTMGTKRSYTVGTNLFGQPAYLLSSTGGTVTVTATLSVAQTDKSIILYEFTYSGTASFDVETGLTGILQTTSGNVTTTGTDEIAFGTSDTDNSVPGNYSAPLINGVAADGSVLNINDSLVPSSVWYKIFSATFTGQSAITGSNGAYVTDIVTFKAVAGAAAVVVTNVKSLGLQDPRNLNVMQSSNTSRLSPRRLV